MTRHGPARSSETFFGSAHFPAETRAQQDLDARLAHAVERRLEQDGQAACREVASLIEGRLAAWFAPSLPARCLDVRRAAVAHLADDRSAVEALRRGLDSDRSDRRLAAFLVALADARCTTVILERYRRVRHVEQTPPVHRPTYAEALRARVAEHRTEPLAPAPRDALSAWLREGLESWLNAPSPREAWRRWDAFTRATIDRVERLVDRIERAADDVESGRHTGRLDLRLLLSRRVEMAPRDVTRREGRRGALRERHGDMLVPDAPATAADTRADARDALLALVERFGHRPGHRRTLLSLVDGTVEAPPSSTRSDHFKAFRAFLGRRER